VPNNKRGARIRASRLADIIHGTPHDGALFDVQHVSDPLADTQDGSAEWWSCTLEIHHHTTRRITP